jgi:FkbM family methyltransferase
MNFAKERAKAILKSVLPKAAYDRLRLRKMRTDRARFAPRIVTNQYGDTKLSVNIEDKVGEDWYDHDWPVAGEVEFLRKYSLRPGSLVFDIGAHQGVVAMMLANELGQKGRIIAVEANPQNADLARRNFHLNKIGNAQVVEAAISDRPGVLTFNEDSNGQVDGSGNLGKIEVRARTIDSLTEEFGSPDLIFLDIEGFEAHALQGATQTMMKTPDLFIEVHVGAGLETFGSSVKELIKLIPYDRYELYFAAGEEPLRFIKQEPSFFFSETNAAIKNRFFLAAVKP